MMMNWTNPPKTRHKQGVIMFLLSLIAGLVGAPAHAGALRQALLDDGQLQLTFDGPVGDAQIVALDEPQRIAIDVAGATPGSVAVRPTALVNAVRQGRVAGGGLRIVLDLNRPVAITAVDRAPDDSAITLSINETSPAQFAALVGNGRRTVAAMLRGGPTLAMGLLPQRRYQVSVPIGPAVRDVPLPVVAGPRDRSLPLIVIDAGHGGHDPGAISPDNGRREKDLTLAIARAVRDELLASGRVRVALTRDNDQFLVLEERYGIARRLGADLFISVHADSAENRTATGASIYTLSEVASDREALRLAARENAANILNGVDLGGQSNDVRSILIDLTQRETMNLSSDFARTLERVSGPDIPFRPGSHRFAGFVVLKAPDMPSVLLETGFISNAADADRIASPAGQRGIARGVRQAVLAHFARQQGRTQIAAAGGINRTAR